eukprot:3175463-Prymnesium_polylepis.1
MHAAEVFKFCVWPNKPARRRPKAARGAGAVCGPQRESLGLRRCRTPSMGVAGFNAWSHENLHAYVEHFGIHEAVAEIVGIIIGEMPADPISRLAGLLGERAQGKSLPQVDVSEANSKVLTSNADALRALLDDAKGGYDT